MQGMVLLAIIQGRRGMQCPREVDNRKKERK
jgi:hypothetical protein